LMRGLIANELPLSAPLLISRVRGSHSRFGKHSVCASREFGTHRGWLQAGLAPASGRYGCNPPYRLIRSLYAAMKVIDEHPKFVVLTGDVAPHGYPGLPYPTDRGSTKQIWGTFISSFDLVLLRCKTSPTKAWATMDYRLRTFL